MGRRTAALAGLLTLKAGLPPVFRNNARVLILGSLPGDASLAAARYYAHPRNQFWQLLGGAMEIDLAALPYEARIDSVVAKRIALWDVVGEARRHASLDSAIRDATINDVRQFAASLPQLRAIAFNGQKSAALSHTRLQGLDVDILHLPSSSPAHTVNIQAKQGAWQAIAAYL